MSSKKGNTTTTCGYEIGELYKYIYASYVGLFTIMKKDRTTFHVMPTDAADFKRWLDENGVTEIMSA